MSVSIENKLIASLQAATQHNSQIMVRPEVILWPDPDRQWESVIPDLQKRIPSLLVFGTYRPEQKQGPAIWLKCMVAKALPEATWSVTETPIIYLPGISKQDFKNITAASLTLQPLMEYQYTGTIWTHENGKEWTVAAFVQNTQFGMGVKMAQDNATRDALLTALPTIFSNPEIFTQKGFIDADFLLSTVFPDVIPTILNWMSSGDTFLNKLSIEKRESFINLCKTRYDFQPDYRNIKEITLKLGSQNNAWAQVWQYYANSPRKYPGIPDLLRMAKPNDLGFALFALPEESWPQVNEEKENELREDLVRIPKLKITEVVKKLTQLSETHQRRKKTVWYELGQAPLVDALTHLAEMTVQCQQSYPSADLKELAAYYIDTGYKADQAMRKALATVHSSADKEAVTSVITYVYKPWLETINGKFQKILESDASVYKTENIKDEQEDFVLFVDALRYELAVEFFTRLQNDGFDVNLTSTWSALPTLTPTAKPFCSPIAGIVKTDSECNEFRPQLNNGKDLLTATFRDALSQKNFIYVSNTTEIDPNKRIWMEIGDIDTKGHEEQSNMVYRIDDLYRNFLETINAAISKGVTRIKVVTDHGWLLLPGGLPKAELSKHLTETKWGRCALIKDGASVDLLHLPWRWNPSVFIAYAPGISFFKKNEEYAHGGLSLQECVVPELIISTGNKATLSGRIKSVKWLNLICKIELEETPDGYKVDIRTKAAEESTSILVSKEEKRIVKDNRCSLIADESSEGSAAYVVLTNPEGIIVDKQMTSVGQKS